MTEVYISTSVETDGPIPRHNSIKPIDRFEGPHRFLSNFFHCIVIHDSETYKSVEHAYQAFKTLVPEQRQKIYDAATPGEAKRLGQKITLRSDWKDIRNDLMFELLVSKFSTPILKRALIDTGSAELIEGNDFNDTYWGVCNGKGENLLGHMLMKVREMANMDIDEGKKKDPTHAFFYNSDKGEEIQIPSVQEFMEKQFASPEIKAVYDRLSKR